jgi:hypothetical protein
MPIPRRGAPCAGLGLAGGLRRRLLQTRRLLPLDAGVGGAWRSWRIEVEDVVEVSPNKVLVTAHHIGEGLASGAEIEQWGTALYTFRRGKILRVDGYIFSDHDSESELVSSIAEGDLGAEQALARVADRRYRRLEIVSPGPAHGTPATSDTAPNGASPHALPRYRNGRRLSHKPGAAGRGGSNPRCDIGLAGDPRHGAMVMVFSHPLGTRTLCATASTTRKSEEAIAPACAWDCSGHCQRASDGFALQIASNADAFAALCKETVCDPANPPG